MSQGRLLDYIGKLISSCQSQGMSSVQGRDFPLELFHITMPHFCIEE